MTATANFLAIDLGASAGRVLLGQWDGRHFKLTELHRFANGPISVLGRQHWDALRLWAEIKTGLARYAATFSSPLAGIGVDTWGVDFALLDKQGKLLGNPHHYRDKRTDGVPERVFERVPRRRIYRQTGIQFMQINTLYQLFSMVESDDPQLEIADTLLMMPDLFNYWLSGQRAAEYTIASTSQMLDSRTRIWAGDLLSELGIPSKILPGVVVPGTMLGSLRADVVTEANLKKSSPIIAIGGHDTASAVVAVPGLDEHSAYISSGTWSLVGVEATEPVLNEQALALNVTNEGGASGTIRLLKNVTGLWLLQACRRQWRREGHGHDWEELLALAEQAPPFGCLIDPDAPEFLNPGDMPTAIQAFCRRSNQAVPEGRGDIVRCCLESLALKYRWVVEALEGLVGYSLNTVRIVGGGSRNHLLNQFTADACERPVVAGPAEATALGNIMVQAVAQGHLGSVLEGRQAIAASIRQRTYEPCESAAWRAAWVRFQMLLEA